MQANDCVLIFDVFGSGIFSMENNDMSLKIVAMVAALVLAGCQTAQQKAETRTKLVCFQAGFGETSPRHDECVRTMMPVALETERQRAFNDIENGLSLIAASRRP